MRRYPYLVWYFKRVLDETVDVTAFDYLHVVGCQSALCALNLYWTWEFAAGGARKKNKPAVKED